MNFLPIPPLSLGNISTSGDISSSDYACKMLGWLISAIGDAEFNSVHIRGFLESDEFRYNRISVVSGETWNAPGGGIIEEVDPLERIIYLKLEPGELAEIEIDDICKGKFNDSVTGFHTSYFRILKKLMKRLLNTYFVAELYFHHKRPCTSFRMVTSQTKSDKDRATRHKAMSAI